MLRFLYGVVIFSGLAFTSEAFALDGGNLATKGAPAVNGGGISGSAIGGRVHQGAIGGPADKGRAGPQIGGAPKPPFKR